MKPQRHRGTEGGRKDPLSSSPCLGVSVAGFTLLEVLIAILVLVMAVSAILPLFAVAMDAHKRGVDQAHLAWIAPRIAAKIRERLYERNPAEIRGYVREMEDGSILIDNMNRRKLPPRQGWETYTFRAAFKPVVTGGGGSDLVADVAFHMTVEVNFLDGGEEQAVRYQTVVLRKMQR